MMCVASCDLAFAHTPLLTHTPHLGRRQDASAASPPPVPLPDLGDQALLTSAATWLPAWVAGVRTKVRRQRVGAVCLRRMDAQLRLSFTQEHTHSSAG